MSVKKRLKPLSRLCGLETEMAIHHPENRKQFSDNLHLFDAIVSNVVQKTAWALSKRFAIKRGAFLANGSAVEFERLLPGIRSGLLEACSAECQSPAEVLASQRGLESLLAEASHQIEQDSVRLIKNCSDPRGSVYGPQENYEVESHDDDEREAHGRLVKFHDMVDRCGFLASAIIPVLLFVAADLSMWRLIAFASLVPLIYVGISAQRRRFLAWQEFNYITLATFFLPTSLASSHFYRKSKIGRTYESMTPFLMSRIVIAGAGMIDKKGRFFIGQKAYSRNSNYPFGNLALANPVVCVNEAILGPVRHRHEPAVYPINPLSKRRLRLSLSIGDSNRCEVAEYLKIATTSLVIDAIEAGYIVDPPSMKKPIRTLHLLNADPALQRKVSTSRGDLTAIEIQQFYLNACRRYVEAQPDAPQEARDVLTLWSKVLRQLSTNPESLFGQIDWITKRELMRQYVDLNDTPSERNTHFEFCKCKDRKPLSKIDFKYHELGEDGYFNRLSNAGLTQSILAPSTIEQARRLPPSSSSAHKRGNYIREFAEEIEWVTWDKLKLVGQSELVKLQEHCQT